MATMTEVVDAAGTSATSYKIPAVTYLTPQYVHAALSGPQDHDWYKVDLEAGKTYSIAMVADASVHVGSVFDPYFQVRDSSGTEIAVEDDHGPGKNASLTFTPAKSGTYLIDASSKDGKAGQYGLSVNWGHRPSYDLTMSVNALTREGTSQSAKAGDPANLTWAIADVKPGYSAFDAAQIQSIKNILGLFTDVANINLTQVNPAGTSSNAKILFRNIDNAGYAGAWNGKDVSITRAGTDVSPGDYTYGVILHEIDHAMSMPHPSDTVEGGHIDNIEDRVTYSATSYYGGAWRGLSVDTPMLFDIYVLQKLYGANLTTRIGDTTYGFHSNAGNPLYDFSQNAQPTFSIWDAGGNDTVDASGYRHDQTIDLHDGSFSNIGDGDLFRNVSIAYNAVIENAIGGSGNDLILVNSVSNVLTGGAGRDVFVFNTALNAASNVDHITDFSVNDDKIWLDPAIFTALAPGALSAAAFHTGSVATTAANRILYDKASGALSYDPDGKGGQEAVQFATLKSGLALSAANFSAESNDALSENAVGGSGNDTIFGNAVSNVLTGQGGRDTFVFHNPLDALTNVDRITDFSTKDDQIQLDPKIFTALAPGGPLAADAFHKGNAAATSANRIIYNETSGALSYDPDGSGGQKAVQFATLPSKLSLSAGNFTIG
jgi:serralysin